MCVSRFNKRKRDPRLKSKASSSIRKGLAIDQCLPPEVMRANKQAGQHALVAIRCTHHIHTYVHTSIHTGIHVSWTTNPSRQTACVGSTGDIGLAQHTVRDFVCAIAVPGNHATCGDGVQDANAADTELPGTRQPRPALAAYWRSTVSTWRC